MIDLYLVKGMHLVADWYLWLTPLLGLGVLALARFVACDVVFGLDRPPLRGVPFVESFVLGTPRTNFTGWAGMVILVGDKPLTVTQLGRIMLTASTASHEVKLVRPAGDGGVDLGTVTIPISAATQGFAYATVEPDVVLDANTEYYVVSHEAAGGDVFHEVLDTSVTTTDVARVTSGVYNDDADPRYRRFGAPGNTYGPVDFKYLEPA
jgi:hypothetical protein